VRGGKRGGRRQRAGGGKRGGRRQRTGVGGRRGWWDGALRGRALDVGHSAHRRPNKPRGKRGCREGVGKLDKSGAASTVNV
jgi:hypothetical protein